MASQLTISSIIILQISLLSTLVQTCPLEYCASALTRCLVMNSCKCTNHHNMTCRIDCATCLDRMFFDCCSCLNLCATVDEESLESEVQLLEPINRDLFDLVLEDEELEAKKWTPFNVETRDLHNETIHCSMLFKSECISLSRCRDECLLMGAGAFRWFHTGCCECVAPKCNNFGINEMKCINCSSVYDLELDYP